MSRTESFNVGAAPHEFIANMAKRYAQQNGIQVPAQEGYNRVAITRPATEAIGHAYDALPEFDNRAVPAYRQMAEETKRQYDFVTRPRHKGGLGIDIEVTKHDPYGQGPEGVHGIVNEIRDDINNHNRIKVFATSSTGGHPIFSDDENDMFRGVHDIFGHLGSGRGIDAHGEEAAFQKHSRMFSPLARQAMATETRGQNAALHLHGGFQNQKVAILPEHLQDPAFAGVGGMYERRRAADAARNENRLQGI